MSAISHTGSGSNGFYELGCRCPECRAARNRYTSLRAKRRRRGTCEDCGGVTRYHGKGGVNGPARLCLPCANKREGIQRRGSGPVVSKALRYLSEPRHYSELRDYLGVSHGYVCQLLYGRLLRFGLVRQVRRGVYVRCEP